ncbi:MAG: PPOX class F420-dependent oxidoreductase [Dactylosporangium sp.]|nr:PPOX class F420-dependent oxidoreductase [Dactylosporangium sp.]NNJ63524.1 PPOX class F420-dependent oxidoreductase [Dactylosporangium sp.]
MTTNAPAHQLGSQKYVLLTTYRRVGTPVRTPVWVAPDGAALLVWTVMDSGKVKRIRNNTEISVAPCTSRGKPLGPAVAGRAEILDAEETRHVRRLIRKKYWLAGPIVLFLSRLRRGTRGTVGLRIGVGQEERP